MDVALIVAAGFLLGAVIGMAIGMREPATMTLLDRDGNLMIEFEDDPSPEQIDRFREVFRKYEARALPTVLQEESKPWDVDPLSRPRSGE